MKNKWNRQKKIKFTVNTSILRYKAHYSYLLLVKKKEYQFMGKVIVTADGQDHTTAKRISDLLKSFFCGWLN